MVDDKMRPLTREKLNQFIAGKLTQAENEKIVGQLAEDEAALLLADALWEEQASDTAVSTLTNLEPERANRLRRRLVHQIQRTELTKNVVNLGIHGFGSVAASLLRPLLNPNNRERRHRRRSRGND